MKNPGVPDRDDPLGGTKPTDFPDIELPDLDQLRLFATLSADVPVLMLPVRLETRFYHDPDRLRIRVYPDQIHVNSHHEALSEREAELGQRFWQIVWNAGEKKTARVFEKLAQALGVWRATWVMESTTPTNIADIGNGQPVFPPTAPGHVVGAPARVDLLPNCWIAVGILDGKTMFTEIGEQIPTELRFAPLQMHAPDDLDRWAVDFAAAQRVGMALEVQLTGGKATIIDKGLDELIVVGMRFGRADILGQSLEDTLRSHYYTRGFDFVPQGTPTNNTETVRSPWQWDSADAESVLQHAWVPATSATNSYRQRFAQALGLDEDGVAARALHGAALDIPGSEAMNHALWYIMWGEYLRFALDDGEQSPLSDATIDWLRDWFIGHVRGGAPIPAFHVGSMPYGILPIQLMPAPSDAHTAEEYLQWLITDLRAAWERSLANVPHLDPTATASATDAPITLDLEAANDNLIAILSSHPHPVSFFTRMLNNLRTWFFWSIFFDPVDIYEGQKNAMLGRINGIDSAWGSEIEHDLLTPFNSLSEQLDYYQDLRPEVQSRIAALQAELQDIEDTIGTILIPPWDEKVEEIVADIETYEAIEQVVENILSLLDNHSDRVYPVNSLRTPPVMDVLSAETPNPEHFYFVFDEEYSTWGDLPLVQAADAQDGATASVYMEWLADYARGAVTGTGPNGMSDPAPLLFQLVKRSVDRAGAWDNSPLVEFDRFLGSINSVSQASSKAAQVGETKRLVSDESSLTSMANLLTGALQAPPKDPTRMAISAVPREAFRNAASQLRDYGEVSRTTTDSIDRLISSLDQWAGQPTLEGKPDLGWGGTEYLPPLIGTRVSRLANAIDVLASLTPQDLELRMKETLGLAMHRLDAWITAYAEAHIDKLRADNPTGIQIAGFGWVENLRPDAAGTSSSQGFIHAPSMTQAAAAAILRSGYSAYSDGTATSPLSVDLRSDRVRVAQWMMDGVRQGQPVNELLGYRFERYLHDAFLDVWIDPVRQVVADHGSTELAADRASAIVDGLALLELWDEGRGTLESLIEKPVDGSNKARPFSEIVPALEHLVWVTDSMADLALAESVHALVQGDYERASAVQNASAFGDVPPPEVRSLLTPNSGMTITHRLLLVPRAEQHAWSDRPMSKRAELEPALEAWVASIIGQPENIRYHVHGDIDQAGEPRSLADLPLSALDAVYLAPVEPGASVSASGLGQWITLEYKQRHPKDTTITIDADIEVDETQMSLADFTLLANSMRRVLSSARPAMNRDFEFGEGSVVGAPTVAELISRATRLHSQFATTVNAIESTGKDLPRAMLQLSFFNFPQALPASADPTSLAAQAASLLPGLQALRDDAQAILTRLQDDQATAEQTMRAARELIAAILGRDYPVMLRFQPPLSPGVIRDQAAVGGGDAFAVTGWLLKMARVRPDLVSVRELITIAETLHDQPMFSFGVAQLPHVPGEAWVGLARPNEEGADRLSLVLTGNGDVTTPNGDVGGLVLDQWVERIPSNYEMTGLAFHFDAPTSRPPQCLLLAVPPENSKWDFELVVATVREAFARARLRAVGPETLGEYGHQLPAVYLTSNLDMIGATTDGG